MNLKDLKIGETIVTSSLNPDEETMLMHLTDSQVKWILKDKHPIQRLGEIFTEETLDELGIDPNASFELENILKEIAPKDKIEKKEAKSLLSDLEKITSNLIKSRNELRNLTASRGKDKSFMFQKKGASSEKVKFWVDELHKLGFLNASLDKATNELMAIEKEIKKFLE